uniref:Reverse transcriptase domain-containing protein n=1 Tax=Tanacetum cinerariifolium TaxID=118510 RepID=A0A6L2KLM4_TANCI|nr:reverse transcriptase domain-containing protein [Tanacetum cinerariifolium]
MKTFISSGVGMVSMQVLHGFEFEVEPLGDHTFEVEPHENINQGAGLQKVQTQDLMVYQLACDREQHLACELFGYREDNNEAAFAVVAVEKIYAHESLTFNNTVAYEVISNCKARLKYDMMLDQMCMCSATVAGNAVMTAMAITGEKGNVLGMEIVRDQSGYTLRVSHSRFYNGKLVQTLLEGHSILSLEGSLSGDCDVEKNDKFDCGLQTDIQVFVDFDYSMGRSITVMGIATGALVKGGSRSEVPAQVEVAAYRPPAGQPPPSSATNHRRRKTFSASVSGEPKNASLTPIYPILHPTRHHAPSPRHQPPLRPAATIILIYTTPPQSTATATIQTTTTTSAAVTTVGVFVWFFLKHQVGLRLAVIIIERVTDMIKDGQNPSKTGQNRAQNGKRGKVNSQKSTQGNQKVKENKEEGLKLPLSKVLYKEGGKNVKMLKNKFMSHFCQPLKLVHYKDIIAIIADNFELKHGLLTLVQNKQFFGHDKEDPHAHVRYFNKITSTLKFPNVLNTEAWDRFKDLLRACPHHGFSKLQQLDTFYNALNSKDQDSLNSAASGNFLDKMPRECLAIIKSKSKVCYSCNKPIVSKVSMNTSTSGISPDVAELKDMVKALLLDKKGQNQPPAPVKAVEESCVTCGGAHSYRNCPTTDGNIYRDNIQEFVSQASAVNHNQGNTSYCPSIIASTSSPGTLPSNTIANPRSDLKEITTRSGVSYDGPQIPPPPFFLPKVVEDKPKATKDTVNPTNNESTKDVQPQVVQSESLVLTSEPITFPISELVITPVSATKPNPKSSIPYPSRINDERNREQANNKIGKFYQIFKDMSFEISFADALILMPKFASTLKALIRNKENLSEMARTPLNEHCYAVILKKLPEKLGDPGKFLIPCDFSGMAECLALADLGASINLMPFSLWKRLSLPDLTPTCMTLDLADRPISHPVGVAEDVYVKVGSFHFPADFVVVDFDADPRVSLILGRSFLKTGRALIDVFKGELTLRVGKKAITFNLDQTSRYSANYNDLTAKRIDVIDMACKVYSQEVLGFLDTISSGNPTPYYDLIVFTTSPTLTLFGNSDFLLEEVDAFLAIEDEPTSPEFYQPYLDPEGDILLLEAFLNDDPSLTPLPKSRKLST